MHRKTGRTRMDRWRRSVTVIAVTGLVLAACGSDNNSSAATTATTATATTAVTATTGATASTTAGATATTSGDTATTSGDTATTSGDTATTSGDTATTGSGGGTGELACAGPAATGDPVEVGVSWPEGPSNSTPELGAAAEAVRMYVNECLGGIAGRPVEYVTCKLDETSPASATDCANKLVEAKVVAHIVTPTAQGQTMVPIDTGAGIPYVGTNPASPAESTDKSGLVFEVSPGVAGYLAAMAQIAKDDSIAKVSLVVSENAAQGVGGLAKIPFASAGIELNIVPVPSGTPDMTSQVRSALEGAGVIGIIGDPTQCIAFLQATKALDPDGLHFILRSCADPAVIDAVGDDAVDKALLFGTTDITSDNAEAVLYKAVMAKYAPDTEAGPSAVKGYQAALAFFRGLEGLTGEVTAATVASTLAATTDVVLPAGAGTAYGCANKPIPILVTVCSGETLVATMDGSTPTDPKVVDAAPLFAS